MMDYPIYMRIKTENDKPYFKNPSCAEAVISVLMNMQQSGWLRMHGFVLLPNELELVASLIRQGVSGTVAELQAESIPLLTVLLPNSNFVWSAKFTYDTLKSKGAFDARLEMLRLSPVAHGITDDALAYPYSSANARYKSTVAIYAGFKNTDSLDDSAAATIHNGDTRPVESPTNPTPSTPPAQDNGSVNAEVPL